MNENVSIYQFVGDTKLTNFMYYNSVLQYNVWNLLQNNGGKTTYETKATVS